MTMSRIFTPILHFDDINGRPLVGGKLYSYLAGTSTPAPLYRNEDGTEVHENPVKLNMRGECVAFLPAGARYKLVLKDCLDNVILEVDGVTSLQKMLSGSEGIFIDQQTGMVGIEDGGVGRDKLKNPRNLVPDSRYLQFKDFGGNVVVTLCDDLKQWLEDNGY